MTNDQFFRVSMRRILCVTMVACLAGCMSLEPMQVQAVYPNPTLVPMTDPDYVWEQVVEVVDDYFKIAREERVRLVGDIVTDGYLETYPLQGATFLEPWHDDTVTSYDRLESTLQSMRRRAVVQVIPDAQGYRVEFAVFKELEDLPRPEFHSAGGATFRSDTSLQRYREPTGDPSQPLGWIPQGRDVGLEQVMIAKLQSRLGK